MKFKVYKRAHKTCDYSTEAHRTRRLKDAVHLETRCGGEAHDGCQAGCLMYWKQAWLRRVDSGVDLVQVSVSSSEMPAVRDDPKVACDESVLYRRTRYADSSVGSTIYRCQTTQIPYATSHLNWWDVRQYLEDVLSGNISFARLLTGTIYSAYFHLANAGIGVGPALRWFYNNVCWLWNGSMFPRTNGRIPRGKPKPAAMLNLQPGELVRIKSHKEILETVDMDNKNRGMYWDAELVPYCGKTYPVLSRVKRLIDERTSKMIEMKTPCIVLESVVCQARYSQCRMFCPREMYPYWREIWLEQVDSDNQGARRIA
ncbi:MAG TPA: hypothetical protein VK638_03925 [Edaphobacter sp.]|nr:hypothetical protein [Edaphobacter sp.]